MSESSEYSENELLPPFEYNQKYSEECPLCTMSINVITQRDNFPEYETDVYVKCQCGNYVHFILPVN
jgi:HKD family nuclease